jgi:hypothetical protein
MQVHMALQPKDNIDIIMLVLCGCTDESYCALEISGICLPRAYVYSGLSPEAEVPELWGARALFYNLHFTKVR